MYSEMCKIIITLEEKLVEAARIMNEYDQALKEVSEAVEAAISTNDQLTQCGEYWMKKAYDLRDYVHHLESKLKNGPGLN